MWYSLRYGPTALVSNTGVTTVHEKAMDARDQVFKTAYSTGHDGCSEHAANDRGSPETRRARRMGYCG